MLGEHQIIFRTVGSSMLRAVIRTPAAQFSYARRYLHFVKETGLYGFDHLKTPKGFQRMVDDAIER